MRNRNIVVVGALVVLAVIGGIVLIANSGGESGDGRTESGPGKRVQAGEGILIEGPFFSRLFELERPDVSQPVTSSQATVSGAARTTVSAAGGAGAPAAVRPAVFAAAPAPACTASLLGSVIGLLGALLGGGGGGC